MLVTSVAGFSVLGSMYDDSGESAGGASLWAYPIKGVYLPKAGKKATLYPVAVYSDKVGFWKYRVISIRNPATKKRIFGHVIDECSKNASSCRKNKRIARKTGRVLVDIHQSAWKALGLKRYGLYKLEARYVNTISRKNKAMKSVLTAGGRHGYVPSPWK